MKKLFKSKKIIIIAILLIIGVFVYFKMNSAPQQAFSMVNTYDLVKKDLAQQITVKAPLEGIEKVDIVSPLNYEVLSVKVKEGDVVKKGDVLAVLDSSDIEKEIDNLNNQIELSQMELNEKIKQTQQEYDKLIDNISDLENTYEQNKTLFENEIITEDAFNKSKSDLEQMKKSLQGYNVVNGKVVATASDVKRIDNQRESLQEAQKNLEEVNITSPIDGTVTRVNINQGRYAKDTDDNKPMFNIENLSKLQMKASVSEYDIADVKIGQSVDITADILKDSLAKGTVERISPTAEQKDNNTMERVIPITIDVTERPDNLIAGVIATGKITVNAAKACFCVPSGAVIDNGDGTYSLYAVKDDNTLQTIPVTLGLETDLETEVIGEGLTEGMKIVANPDETMFEGMPVTVDNAQ